MTVPGQLAYLQRLEDNNIETAHMHWLWQWTWGKVVIFTSADQLIDVKLMMMMITDSCRWVSETIPNTGTNGRAPDPEPNMGLLARRGKRFERGC